MNGSAGRAFSTSEFEAFHAQLAMLVDAGMPLPDGLRKLARAGRDPKFRASLDRLAGRLDQGRSLADAMGDEPGTFSDDYLALIKVGERSGDLKSSLSLALDQEFFNRNFRARLQRSLTYPAVVFVLATITYLICIGTSYPMFLSLVDATTVKAPGISLAVYRIFDFIRHDWLLIAVPIAGLAALSRLSAVRTALHGLWLKTPFLGPVLVSRFLASFSQSMAIGLKAGITTADALSLLARLTPNRAIRAGLEQAAARAQEGVDLTTLLPAVVPAPEFFMAALAAGEEGKVLPESLSQLAEVYRDDTQQRARLFIQLLDTALIVGLGVWVGVILIAFYLLYLTMVMGIDHTTIW